MSNPDRYPLGSWQSSFASFSSSDLTRIVGMPGPIQRLWRSRGYLKKRGSSAATFTSLDAAEILVRYDLSRLGVPPSESQKIGEAAAWIVLLFALLNSDGTCEVIGGKAQVESFITEFDEDEALAFRLCQNPEIHRFVFRTPDADTILVDGLDNVTERLRARAGAFLDLERAAEELSARARGPLLTVFLGSEEEPEIRRLTGHRAVRLRLVETRHES